MLLSLSALVRPQHTLSQHAPTIPSKIVPGNNGIFMPAIVVAGQVVGTWKRTQAKNALGLTLYPFAPLAVSDESIAAAAQRYGDFIGASVASIDVAGA